MTNTDGTRLENTPLQVVSQNATVGYSQTITTGGDGTYVANNLPLGKFTVTVLGLPSGLAGYGSGTITADGQSVTVDIQIVSSTISLPFTLTDADSFPYKVGAQGEFDSAGAYYTNFAYGSAQQLTLTSGGTSSTFGYGGAPTTALQSLSGQQIEINQPSLAGLNVTRKIYVPPTGYFARRLEVLQNTTSAPITVSVSEAGVEHYTIDRNINIVANSAGTTTLDANSLWAVSDDDLVSQLYPQTEPAIADVFGGAGAPVGVAGATSYVGYYSGYSGNSYHTFYNQQLTYTYKPVTIPANSTASFLFFSAQEAGSATAITAAKRLVQLPAEALDGLSASDLASVVNFVVPTTPLPAVAPPATSGVLNGQVFAGDGTTPIPNAAVYEQSTDLYYGTGTATTADASGNFTLPYLLATNYVVQAVDPVTSVRSQNVTGSFPNGVNIQPQNISFVQTGILNGAVQATGQTQITGGSTYLTFSCLPGQTGYCGSTNLTFDSTGIFHALTVPAGNVGITVYVTLKSGSSVSLPSSGSYNASITAGQTTQFTVTVPATGNIAGTVTNSDGTPAVGIAVHAYGLTKYGGSLVTTDSNGKYSIISLPLDTYTVSVTDATTSNTVTKNTTVTQDATSVVDLKFIGKGTVNVTTEFANGAVAGGIYMYISTVTVPAFNYAGQSDGSGLFTFNNVPTGAFTIRAYYPNQNFYSTTSGTVTGTNQTQQLIVLLPPVGTISGKVTNADGTSPGANAYVTVSDHVQSYNATAQTDSAGNYAFYPVPADRLVDLYSNSPNITNNKPIRATAVNQQVPGDGQTLTINLRYPGLASVRVTALQSDGTPYTQGYIGLKSNDGLQNFTKSVGTDGSATFTDIVESTFVAYFQYNSVWDAGSTTFTVPPAADGTTVQVTIHTSPKGSVQGMVFASDGVTPLSGGYYDVRLQDVATSNSSSANYNGGAYSFADVQVGASGYKLTAQLYNESSTVQTVSGNITTEGQSITQNFTLPVWSISGKVYLNDGVTPAPNTNSSVAVGPSGSTTYYSGSSDAQGVFQISGVATGSTKLTASDYYGVNGSITVDVPSISTVLTGQRIVLGPAGTVMGTVYDTSGIPQPNVYVNVEVDSSNYYQSLTTDGSGHYTAYDVAIGNVKVEAYLGGCGNGVGGGTVTARPMAGCNGGTEIANGVLVNNGDVITVNLGQDPAVSGVIFGTVYDSNQNPSEGATVKITAASPSTYTTSVQTNASGVYQASNLPIGEITAQATLTDGSSTDPVTGSVPTPFKPVEIDLGLQTTGQVSGVITNVNDQLLAGATVEVNSDGDPNSYIDESSANDGSFVFSNIAPGNVTITVMNSQGDVIGTGKGVLPYGGNVVINVKTTTAGAQNRPLPLLPPRDLPVMAWLQPGRPAQAHISAPRGE